MAIRRDEQLFNIHSYNVDHWDWELVLNENQRTQDTLVSTVTKIYEAMKETQNYICDQFSVLDKFLPESIMFITSQELEDLYPKKTLKE